MTINEKKQACNDFFNQLAEALSTSHEVLGSCNTDISAYLCPNGTTDQVTYQSKPVGSFRVSDHWNWFANVNKCPDEHYIQCFTQDMPRTKLRSAPGKASKPVNGTSVMLFGEDHKYHTVYGERFDRKTKKWEWVEVGVDEVVAKIT